MYKTFQLIPDRTVDNKRGHEFMRAMHDVFRPWYKRIQGRHMNKIERLWYTIRIRPKDITFYIGIGDENKTFLNQRINRYWSKSTMKESDIPPIPPLHTLTAEMKYRRHNIFSLSADWREDTIPIAAILNVVRDMKDGDEARVVVCAEPYPRMTWADFSERAHEEFKQGKTPSRRGIAGKLSLKSVATVLDTVMTEAGDMVETIFESESEAKAKDRKRKTKPDLEKREIMLDGKLEKSTMQKRNEPCYKTHIFITSTSEDISRRAITLRALSNAFTELSGDNELKRFEHGRNSARIIAKLNSWNIPLTWDANIMSSSEVGKLFQLPTASQQDEYAEHLQIIEHRETDLPAKMLKAGLLLGTVTFRGVARPVYFPIDDHDELCLPRIVIGGMGMGKTKGFGGNFAVEAVRNGFTCVTIDVAKGELGDVVLAGLKKLGMQDKFIRIRFGDNPIGLDWCEALGSKFAVNRFASEVLHFFDLHGAEAGIETSRYIRLAAKTVAHGSGKLSEVIRLFVDDAFRESHVERLNSDLRAQWDAFDKLSPGMRGKVLEPILNRLDMLVGDDYLRECLEANNGIDFRDYLNKGVAVCVDISKDELGSEAVDIIASIVIAKVWLAILSRKELNQPPAFMVMDEPHQFMSSAKHWKSMVVESRKWRLGLVWMFHSWEQIPKDLAEIIKSAGPHYHLYTSSKKTYRDLSEEIAPFELEEALKTPRYHAINIVRSGGVTVAPFMAKMTPPPG